MPRKQTLIVQCDRDGCKSIGEIETGNSPTDAPTGWIAVTTETNNKYDPHLRFEFCGERCVGLWANARHKHLKTTAAGNGDGNGGTITDARASILEAVEVAGDDGAEFISRDIQALSERTQSVVDRHLSALVDDGTLELTFSGGRTPGTPRRYRKAG